jgi:hypothetical protein
LEKPLKRELEASGRVVSWPSCSWCRRTAAVVVVTQKTGEELGKRLEGVVSERLYVVKCEHRSVVRISRLRQARLAC